MTNQEFNDKLDTIVLDLVHKGTMLPGGKTINARMFPEEAQSIRQLFEEVIGKGEECDGTCDDGIHESVNRKVAELRSTIASATNIPGFEDTLPALDSVGGQS